MPLSPEHLEALRLGRERAEQERAAGLRPALTRKIRRRPANHTASAEPITETAEFKEALKASVDQAIRAILPTIAGSLPPVATRDADHTDETLSKLAMLIAELTDQGSSAPKRIPPEIIMMREKAHKRMMSLIEKEREAQAKDPSREPPRFQLVAKMVARVPEAGEVLLEPMYRGADNRVYPTELGWLDIPNLAMEPQNASARAIMDAFKESIGNKIATSFKMHDDDPEPNEGIVNAYAVTASGNVVTSGSATLMNRNLVNLASAGQQAGVAVVRNEPSVLVQNPGAPAYKDVRVLGSIASPARQTG